MGFSQAIQDELEKWEGVSRSPHRFGGVEYNLSTPHGRMIEIGHVHGNYLVDIPFTRKIREVLVMEGKAEPHHVLPKSGWISFYMKKDSDVENALFLLCLSYLQKLRTGRNRHNPQLEQQIRSMNLSAALQKAVLGEEYIEESPTL
jgi:hypothetical protein